MTKLLILDKDGTLVVPKSGQTFVQFPEDQKPIKGIQELVKTYHMSGWRCCIVSNQGGVGAGFKTIKEAIAEMQYCMQIFPEIKESWFCPDLKGQKLYYVEALDNGAEEAYEAKHMGPWLLRKYKWGGYRKPQPGMLFIAMHYYAHSPNLKEPKEWVEQKLYVGDRPEDKEAAERADVPFLWARDWQNWRTKN